jgi:hypothetical protein
LEQQVDGVQAFFNFRLLDREALPPLQDLLLHVLVALVLLPQLGQRLLDGAVCGGEQAADPGRDVSGWQHMQLGGGGLPARRRRSRLGSPFT